MDEPKPPERRRRRRKKSVRLPPWLGLLISAPLALLLSWWFSGTQGFYVRSGSMMPALMPEDRLQADTWFSKEKGPKRGEIWIISNPKEDDEDDHNGPYLVKRIVAVPGDSLEIRKGKLLVNGRVVDEPYVKEAPTYTVKPLKLDEGRYYALGDNRNFSGDSHLWGPLPKARLVGKVFVRFWPLGRWTKY